MRRSAGALVAAAWWLVVAICSVRAEAPAALIAEHFERRGADTPRLLGRGFLFEGQALVQPLSFEHDGCRGVFAWGGAGLRDVDLGIYAQSGLALAEDRGAAPYGYTRLCAAAGVRVFVSAQAYAGRGELALYVVDAPPRALGRLPSTLPVAVAAGGRVSATRAVGGEAAELSVEAPLLHDERQLASAGYVALGAPSLLEVRAGLAEGTLLLPAQRCFRAVAFVPGARGLIFEIEAGGERREARSADAELLRLSLCQGAPQPLLVRVRTRALRSLAVVRVFEHPGAQLADAARFDEERALLLAEARLLAESRGFRLLHAGEAWSEQGASVRWPLVSAGGCVLAAALPAPGTEPELLLVDAAGSVLARNEGRRGLSTVFACAPVGTALEVLVRGHAGTGPVSLWLGQGGGT
jgi:hypothetical protein